MIKSICCQASLKKRKKKEEEDPTICCLQQTHSSFKDINKCTKNEKDVPF